MILLAVMLINFHNNYSFVYGLSLTSLHSTLNIGLFGEKFNSNGTLDEEGNQAIAAMLMAVIEFNNKFDSVHDDILPLNTLNVALRSTGRDYIKGINLAQDVSLNSFNKSGILAAIGAGNNEGSKAIAQMLSYTPFKVNIIDYNANLTDFSHRTTYKYYHRTCISESYDGLVIARVLSYYGFKTVSVFSSLDLYGADTRGEFTLEAERLGIEIENMQTFSSGNKDLRFQINNMKKYGILKVFVLLMSSADAAKLLEQGYNLGLFHENTIILGTKYVLDPSTWQLMSTNAAVAKIMHGVIGVRTYLPRDNLRFTDFVKRFRAQNSTKVFRRDGTCQCSEARDDDGHYLYLQESPTTDCDKCAGMDFSRIKEDGSNILDIAVFAYDAVLGVANALHNTIYKHKRTSISGEELALVFDETEYMGVSGWVDFYGGEDGTWDFGIGDRHDGMHYQIINFNSKYYGTDGTSPVRIVGYMDMDARTISLCDPVNEILCSSVVFNTADGLAIADVPDIIEIEMSARFRAIFHALGSICLLVVLFFFAMILLYMDTKIIKSIQPGVMAVVSFGTLLACMEIFLATVDITDAVCMASMWVSHLSFGCVFLALFIKVWRLRIITTSGFSKVKITKKDMYKLMAGIFAFFCLILVINAAVGHPRRQFDQSFDGHMLLRRIKCHPENINVARALFVIEGLVLFVGVKMCWDAKDAPGAINESTNISLSMYLILFVAAVIFPIVFLRVNPTPENFTAVTSVGFLVATIGVLLLLFGHRSWLAIEGVEVDENLNIVRRTAQDSKESRPDKGYSRISEKLVSQFSRKFDSSLIRDQSFFGRKSILEKDSSDDGGRASGDTAQPSRQSSKMQTDFAFSMSRASSTRGLDASGSGPARGNKRPSFEGMRRVTSMKHSEGLAVSTLIAGKRASKYGLLRTTSGKIPKNALFKNDMEEDSNDGDNVNPNNPILQRQAVGKSAEQQLRVSSVLDTNEEKER